MRLESFCQPCNVAIVGASGGIGSAFLRLLDKDARIGQLLAFSRSPVAVDTRASSHRMDICDESSVKAAADFAAEAAPLDLVIVATGALHLGTALQPEKSLRELTARNLEQLLRINTIGPMLVAKHFLPLLRRNHKAVFAVLSARVGSIGDNRLGGWYSYRMSKAALNMGVRGLSIEQGRRAPHSIVVALHPGTVATGLSQPFSARIAADSIFDAEFSATRLLEVIDTLCEADSGGFFAWDGSRIEY